MTFRRLACVLLVLLATALPSGAAPAATAGQAGAVVAQAEFQFGDTAWRSVPLPHSWALDALPNGGTGRYRLAFDLPEVPGVAWSLGADRMSSRRAVRLNGALIQGELPLRATGHRAAPLPSFIDLPPALLRVGRNTLEIDVDFDVRGGMSSLRLGPSEWVRPAYARALTFGVTVPQALNVGATVLAVFMLTIWVRRRSETELGAFCALMAVVSFRNVVSTGLGDDWHGAVTDFVLFAAQVASMVLLAWFALAFARRDWPWFRRGAGIAGTVIIAAGAVATWQDAMIMLRVWVYPLVLAMVAPSVWLIVVGARNARGWRQVALTLAILLLVGAAVHDYFYLRGLTPVIDRYWMPFTSPLALLVFSWALLDRFVGALASVEMQASELERKVAERTRELEVANAAKTRFLAAASHDLRQPVVSISLLSELLREQPVPPAFTPILARIGDSVQALNALLKGLLDLSRFDAGAVEVRVTRLALRPLLERAIGDEAEAARRKGLRLRVHAAPYEVHSDPVLLEQILRNLVGNAVRHTPAGGVLVSARRRRGRVLMQVWDTGPGIPPQSQAQVFDEFVQLDNEARERSRGLGLRLSLVRRAACLLDIPVTLRSAVGRGSCFSVVLPLAGWEPARRHAGSIPGSRLDGREVWVVEDDPEVREALRLRLAGWGADVHAFGDVAAVRGAMARGKAPQLLISDQRLPDGTGLQVAQILHAAGTPVPVLLVTGDTSPQDIARLRASGVPVLYKPFTSDELLAAVQALAAPALQAD